MANGALIGRDQRLRSWRAKQAIQFAFNKIGGIEAFAEWARENPTEFYTKIYVKLLPLQVKGSLNVNVKRAVHDYTDAELQAIVAGECQRIAAETPSENVTL